MDSEEKKGEYYIIIPPEIRTDKRLLPLEKMLYGEIATLSKKKGYSYATNQYFAEIYGVTTRTITKSISNLEKYNYITIKLENKNNKTNETERRIYIKLGVPLEVDFYPPRSEFLPPLEVDFHHNIYKDNIYKYNNKMDSLQDNINYIDREKLGVYEKESIKNEFLENFNEYKDLVCKATGLDKFQVDNLILPSKLRKRDIRKLIKKVEESDYLMGKLPNTPKISTFSSEHCLNLILADNYKNRDSKKKRIDKTEEIKENLRKWEEEYKDD